MCVYDVTECTLQSMYPVFTPMPGELLLTVQVTFSLCDIFLTLSNIPLFGSVSELTDCDPTGNIS